MPTPYLTPCEGHQACWARVSAPLSVESVQVETTACNPPYYLYDSLQITHILPETASIPFKLYFPNGFSASLQLTSASQEVAGIVTRVASQRLSHTVYHFKAIVQNPRLYFWVVEAEDL